MINTIIDMSTLISIDHTPKSSCLFCYERQRERETEIGTDRQREDQRGIQRQKRHQESKGHFYSLGVIFSSLTDL